MEKKEHLAKPQDKIVGAEKHGGGAISVEGELEMGFGEAAVAGQNKNAGRLVLVVAKQESVE